MIIGNQKKLYYKKKAWLTPKHPFYFEEVSFRIHYAAAVIIQARKHPEMELEQNFELDRLLYRGLGLDASQTAQAMRLSDNMAEVMDYLYAETEPGPKRYFLMLDFFNVCDRVETISRGELENIELFARMLDISEKQIQLFRQFIQAAQQEKEAECRSVYRKLEHLELGISLMELKYYLMTLYDIFECTQKDLDEKRDLRLVDRCMVKEDLVLRKGMRLVLDHAVVRIYGNIALEGGELVVENSRIIRKGRSHRACVNIRHGGIVRVNSSDIDCRNQGMFIRAQDGEVQIQGSEIYQTTRGAAIRFWGQKLSVQNTAFHHCYSPEDGGAIMTKGGETLIQGCRFWHCEAGKGGAIYGKNDMWVKNCSFQKCYAAEYGAAVFYVGMIGQRVSNLKYSKCFPEHMETVQYLSGKHSLDVASQFEVGISTIFDGEIDVMPQGNLRIHDAVIYLKHPIRCRGYLELERVRIFSNEMEHNDMIVLEHARGCRIRECRLDGMGKQGGIFSSGTRIEVENSVFCNMRGGRAIFNALYPVIKECVFNYCQDGGIHCQGGSIERCQFVNCRGKSGAGVTMLGKRGRIERCQFIRCIADVSGGAIDKNVGNQVVRCEFRDCKPGDA